MADRERNRAGLSDADRERQQPGLTDEELAAEQGTDLPDREAMSIMDFGFSVDDIDNLNLAVPINQAIATNINTNASIASADADQVVIVDQGLSADQVEQPPVDRVEHPDDSVPNRDGGSKR
jgi:hypothetical protein